MPPEEFSREEISNPCHLPENLMFIVQRAAMAVFDEGISVEEALKKVWNKEAGESLPQEEFDDPNARALVHGFLMVADLMGEEGHLEDNVFPCPDGPEHAQSTIELTEEQRWFIHFKIRFDALAKLHEGIEWADVERSLKADPEAVRKLMALDEKGHKMNVFGEDGDEFIFASAWDDYAWVSKDHRNIVFDAKAQEWLRRYIPEEKCNGNAIDIAKDLKVDLADTRLHEKLRRATAVNGRAWLKTHDDWRSTGYALYGFNNGVDKHGVRNHAGDISLRVMLRIKKVAAVA